MIKLIGQLYPQIYMSELSDLISVFKQFLPDASVQSIVPFGNGHINDTYKVTLLEPKSSYILQKKNHFVFKDIENMMLNIQKVTEHIRAKLISDQVEETEKKVMTYLPASNEKLYYKTEVGDYWTVCVFVENCVTVENVKLLSQAFNTGKAFGIFQKQLEELPGSSLAYTIPDFHNGIKRLNNFKEAISKASRSRIQKIEKEVDLLTDISGEMTAIQRMLDSGALPLRITHNDTKINNVLFDPDENILCIIDLDTVMPGTILFDFGDAVRTICNAADEDEQDTSKIEFNSSFFKAFTEGYLSEALAFLTPKELDLLHLSGIYMTWEQALRFATDYLSGDIYYKIKYPEHNLVRTKAQTTYLQILLSQKSFMSQFISSKTEK